MYNPQYSKSENLDEVFALMYQHPFATLITVTDGNPHISHVPLTPKRLGEGIELIGHIARANPQWKSFPKSHATVIFHGPQTYITPKWYAENDVPTWNYVTVHVSGQIEIIEDQNGLVECLRELSAHAEKLWPSGWEFFLSDDLSGDILFKSIVGFRIKVEELQYKKKLSQNRTAADRVGVMNGLQTRTDDNSHSILQEMRKIFGGSSS